MVHLQATFFIHNKQELIHFIIAISWSSNAMS